MRTTTQIALLFLVALLSRVCVASESDKPKQGQAVKVARSDDKGSKRTLTGRAGTSTSDSPSASISAEAAAVLEPTQPEVLLSSKHQETCRKRIGEQIDDVAVTDIAGKEYQLKSLLSDRLTVLILWNDRSFAGTEQFLRIPVDILAEFASQRVKVIAANVGGDLETTKRLTGDGADKIVSLVDSDSALFKQFATSHLPRTYVLDKDGKILWFDLEYSQSTRRELANALRYYLANPQGSS